jgi:hypothetical protein
LPPFLTFRTSPSKNHLFESTIESMVQISFHHLDEFVGKISFSRSILNKIRFPYLATKTSFHKNLSLCNNYHHHFANKLMLTTLISLTPRPPLLFSWHTVSHLIQLIFLPPVTPPHKNSLWIRTTFFHTWVRILRYERIKIGIEFGTALRRTVLPPKLMYLLPQDFNLFRSFSNKGSLNERWLMKPKSSEQTWFCVLQEAKFSLKFKHI